MKVKFIRTLKDVLFLIRLSFYCKDGSSYKIHIIIDDDTDFHSHPWDFKSLIIFGGYYEYVRAGNKSQIFQNEPNWFSYIMNHHWGSINEKLADTVYKTRLKRLFGIKIPAITIGKYSKKKQLCSLCKELGYCKTTGKPV